MPDGKCISATSQCCARERRRCWSACRRPSAVSSTDCSTSWALTCRTGPRRRNYSGHRMGERSATQFTATDVRSLTSISDLVAACKGAMPLGFVRAGFRDDPINGVATVLVGSCLRALWVECQLYTLLARKRPFRIREEFRTPAGVRKSPENEPAGPGASYGDLRFRCVLEGAWTAARSIRA